MPPMFSDAAAIGDLVFTAGAAIEPITLPRASGGDIDPELNDGELSDYSFDPAELPDGLTFDRFTGVLEGTPVQAMEQTEYTLWVHDDDEDESAGDADTLAFTITVEADPNRVPSFAEGTEIGDLGLHRGRGDRFDHAAPRQRRGHRPGTQ